MKNPQHYTFSQHPSLLLFIYSWFISMIHSVLLFLFDMDENHEVKSLYTEEEIFLEDHHIRFLETYDSGVQDKDANVNMDNEFYDSELYKKTIAVTDNDFEKKWKRNILYMNTPRGNIVMIYDAYKKGFAYYCDTQSVSSNILNALAMKYVLVFRCRDLFIDNYLTPDERDSPLIQVQINEENAEKEKKKENNIHPINPDLLKNAPFAKLKKHNTNSQLNRSDPESEKEKEKIHYTNKFIYLGKILNFSFMPKKTVRKNNIAKCAVFQGSKMELLFDQEHELQKDVMSYKDFKKAFENAKKKME
jgi:hypothetical protein